MDGVILLLAGLTLAAFWGWMNKQVIDQIHAEAFRSLRRASQHALEYESNQRALLAGMVRDRDLWIAGALRSIGGPELCHEVTEETVARTMRHANAVSVRHLHSRQTYEARVR